MDRLILMRHGKAERDSKSGEDFDRKLTDRGVRESAAMAANLADLGLVPDIALVSAAQRTRETWAAAQGAFPACAARLERSLYLAEERLVRELAEAAGESSRTVMVVGHNPGMHELALRLALGGEASPIQTNKLRGRFPTATVVVLAWDGTRDPRLEHLLYANENGGMGGE